MNQLQLASILEKNKIASAEAFLIFLEIIIPGLAEHIRVVLNNEDVVWNSQTWVAFPFELEEVTESKTELPSLNIKVSNVNRVMNSYVEHANGATGSMVILRVVNSANLASDTPDVEETFSVQQITVDVNYATIKLGADAATTLRRPFWAYSCRNCRWKFKSVQCGYSGAETVCNKTLSRCKALSNTNRWGGQVGITGKLYAN